MKLKYLVFSIAMLPGFGSINAQAPVPAPNTVAPTGRRMFIGDSSAAIPLGKADLIVGPLTYRSQAYSGDYQIKVVPYFFKSEAGTLKLQASEESVQKLGNGISVEFTGKATNNRNGKPKSIKGKATPSTSERGRVIFTVTTDNGPVIFKTSYRLGE